MTDLERNVHAVADEIRDAERGLYDETGGAWEWIEDQLELYADRRTSSATGSAELTMVGALVTYGGPTIRVSVDPGDPDTVAIRGTWASDSFETFLDAPATAAALLEWAASIEGGER